MLNSKDRKLASKLIDEIMEASKYFPNVIIYLETLMHSYEDLEKENRSLKEECLVQKKIIRAVSTYVNDNRTDILDGGKELLEIIVNPVGGDNIDNSK